MKTKNITALILVFAAAVALAGGPLQAETDISFDDASDSVQQRLDASIAELNDLRERAAAERIPLSRKLAELENTLVEVRREYQQTTRLLDSRTLDLNNLRNEIKSRKAESTYLSNLLGEYIRNFESRLHICEIQRYREPLEAAKLAPENSNLSEQEVFKTQANLVSVSLDRLHEALGGARFTGTAVDAAGLVKDGTFVLVGPNALFRSNDGNTVGSAQQRLGSLEPTVIAFGQASDTTAAASMVADAAGQFPLDPSGGNAHKIEATKQTLWEHIQKGGVVMYPILGMAAAAMLVALYKWVRLAMLAKPAKKQIDNLLAAVATHDETATQSTVKAIRGPVGKVLAVGVEHIKEPRELVEEVMYEVILATRLRLQSLLPFVAISASSAPLLGLLGTVTGIINTFKLITVFGSGDVKTLSGGISEALITTEFGLIVAIPSLLLHAFLSRKARSMANRMEAAAMSLLNQLGKTPHYKGESIESMKVSAIGQPKPAGKSVGKQVKDALIDLLTPALEDKLGKDKPGA